MGRRQAQAQIRRRRHQAQALEKLRQAQRAANAGVVSDDRIAVAQFLDRWVRVNLAGSVAGSTMDDHANTVRLHLEPSLGRKKLPQLTVANVDALWAAKREAGYKPTSIRIPRSVLCKAPAQAEREGLVTKNVAALSQPARLSQPEGRALSIEQALTLLDAAKGDRLEAAHLLLLSYGTRSVVGREVNLRLTARHKSATAFRPGPSAFARPNPCDWEYRARPRPASVGSRSSPASSQGSRP
jgi:hypothetical protein